MFEMRDDPDAGVRSLVFHALCDGSPSSRETEVVTAVEALQKAIGNDAIEFSETYPPTESPVSELREDIRAAVSEAVHVRYPGVRIMPYMESGGTDGMHFRKAGIPTWAVSSMFMNPDEMFAHGLNERVPVKAFYDALDHWSIILKELASD